MSRCRRGVALLLVLWLLVILGTVGASIAMSVRGRLHVATNLRDRVVARAAAESGIIAASQAMEDSLARLGASAARDRFLNTLDGTADRDVTIGDGRFRVSYVDVNARLDVNHAGEDALTRFFAQFSGGAEARDFARDVRRATGADASSGVVATPLLSVDALAAATSMSTRMARAVTPFITVDGDGNVNLAHAAPPVRVSAAGQMVDAPTRVMIVSRGARLGSLLTHEIEAVYAIQGPSLALVRWRERDL